MTFFIYLFFTPNSQRMRSSFENRVAYSLLFELAISPRGLCVDV